MAAAYHALYIVFEVPALLVWVEWPPDYPCCLQLGVALRSSGRDDINTVGDSVDPILHL